MRTMMGSHHRSSFLWLTGYLADAGGVTSGEALGGQKGQAEGAASGSGDARQNGPTSGVCGGVGGSAASEARHGRGGSFKGCDRAR